MDVAKEASPCPDPHPSADEVQAALHTLSVAIKHASSCPDPSVAAGAIDELWDEVLVLTSLAESRMRILVRDSTCQQDEPGPDDAPAWIAKDLDGLQVDEGQSKPSTFVLADAWRLTTAMYPRFFGPRPRFDVGPMGAIEVQWRNMFSRRVTWVVDRSRLPWPGVNVRIYMQDHTTSLAVPTVRSVHVSSGVIAYTSQWLKGSEP